jgi:hypothetical protein
MNALMVQGCHAAPLDHAGMHVAANPPREPDFLNVLDL